MLSQVWPTSISMMTSTDLKTTKVVLSYISIIDVSGVTNKYIYDDLYCLEDDQSSSIIHINHWCLRCNQQIHLRWLLLSWKWPKVNQSWIHQSLLDKEWPPSILIRYVDRHYFKEWPTNISISITIVLNICWVNILTNTLKYLTNINTSHMH